MNVETLIAIKVSTIHKRKKREENLALDVSLPKKDYGL